MKRERGKNRRQPGTEVECFCGRVSECVEVGY